MRLSILNGWVSQQWVKPIYGGAGQDARRRL